MITTLAVQVTQEDIDKGIQECEACPIALATNRALKNRCSNFISVVDDGVKIMDNLGYVEMSAEKNIIASQFIKDFDNGWEVKPCELIFHFN